MALTAQQVQQFYIGYYGRPADPVGLAYWQTQDEATALKGFSESAEFTNQFTGLSASQQVTKVYGNLLGRTPDTAGLLYWAGELTAGRETIGSLVLSMLKNALGKDVTTIEDRVTYSTAFTTALNTAEEINAYAGTAATQAARDALLKVVATAVGDHTALNAETAKIDATIATIVSGGSSNPGETSTLTVNADTVKGTAGDDTIKAIMDNTLATAKETLNVGDDIDGGAGRDTLVIEADQALVGSIKNVETFQFVGSAKVANDVAIDASLYTGLDTISLKNVSDTTVTLNKLASGSTVNLQGSTSTTVAASAATGATALNITSSALKAFNTVNVDGAALTTVNFTGETGALADGGGIVIDDANSTADTVTTVNVKATGTTLLQVSGSKIATIDASASTGAANIIIGTVAADLTVKGGAGDDVIALDIEALSAKDSINLGAGNNTVILDITVPGSGTPVNFAAASGVLSIVDSTTAGYGLINKIVAEQITFNSKTPSTTLSIDASKLTTSKIGLMDTGTVSKLLNADTVISDTTGKTFKLQALRDTNDATKFATDAGTVNVVSQDKGESVTVAANDGTNSDFSKLVLSGKGDVVFANTSGVKTTVDASALTGTLTFTADAKVETVTLGAGKDVLNFSAGKSTYAATDIITGFAAGDTLKIGVTAKADLVKFDAVAAGSVSFEQALTQAAAAATQSTSKAAWFNWTDGHTYVVQDSDSSAAIVDQASTDIVIKLVGNLTLTADTNGITVA